MTQYYVDIANSPKGWMKALEIISEYMPDGMYTKYFLEAEHDIIYSHVSDEDIPEDSADGKALSALGWHLDSEIGVWAYFT